jgi:glutaredoxin
VYDTLLTRECLREITPAEKMGPPRLFIKSIRVPIATYQAHDVPGHYCQDGYRTESTMIRLSPEDNQAREILARSGIKFQTIDLSELRGRRKLIAFFEGVRKTPTLLVEDKGQRKYAGVRAISDYVTALDIVG